VASDHDHFILELRIGAGNFRHRVKPVLVLATLYIPTAVVFEATLSYLGLGIQPPTPSWGAMLAEGRDYMLLQWWLAAFPGMAIFLAALGINLLGDALRDLVDPYLRKT